jgi:very-short-patch-repair endonuclease
MDELRHRARTLRNHATDAERHLWHRLRLGQLGGHKFRRQVPVAGYIADFVAPQLKLIVELDGGQHADQVAYDAKRSRALESAGYWVVRYWNDAVLLQTEAVLEDVLRVAEMLKSNDKGKSKSKSTPPQPSPSLREREGAKA